MSTVSDYPHLGAMAAGTISGYWRDWPKVKPEAKAALEELRRLRKVAAELDKLRTRVSQIAHDPATCSVCRARESGSR